MKLCGDAGLVRVRLRCGQAFAKLCNFLVASSTAANFRSTAGCGHEAPLKRKRVEISGSRTCKQNSCGLLLANYRLHASYAQSRAGSGLRLRLQSLASFGESRL